MIKREILNRLTFFSTIYPVVTVTGPRQSGKTTLVKQAFPDYEYISLEDPDIRMIAINDPRKLIEGKGRRIIIDEVQRVPDLFSYIQGMVDNPDFNGQYILTGSQNFLLLESISQTLAGRVAILKLMPLSISELFSSEKEKAGADSMIFNGLYPRLYDRKINAVDYYPFYIQTYVERDVKLIRNIPDQTVFIRFIKMCAGRIGQLLNITDLANSCGISQITAKAWLSVLEASYLIYFLQPYYQNFNKRLVKMPKLYFVDTGLACSLLGINSSDQLPIHYLYGALFENFIINEFFKHNYNNVKQPELYFWRDKHGKEVDLIVSEENKVKSIEIKAGKTFSYDFMKNIKYWNNLSDSSTENSFVIYGGDKDISISEANILSWKNINMIL